MPTARPAAAKPSGTKRPERALRGGVRGALDALVTPYDPLTSLVLTIPVFLIYHLGILFTDGGNGADLVTPAVAELLHRSRLGYIALTLVLTLVLFAVGTRLRRAHQIDRAALVTVVSESAIWAGLMMIVVGGIVARIFQAQIGVASLGPLDRFVLAAGAGFHEELLFRVILFSGGAWLVKQATGGRTSAELIVAPIAATLFSAAHYVGPAGDAFALSSFTFRFLAGMWFTLVFRVRGFAVAVYTHALYDWFVFFLH